ncbi:MAG TPA: hypothetical protein VIP11_18090 [Gemmatimonadaceae bacterium]
MTEPATSAPSAPPLQFDRAVSTETSQVTGVACSQCGKALTETYYTLERKPFCADCKTATEDAVAATRTKRVFGKAFAWGLGAAFAGAIIYYAVIALFELEIGIVAILIGYMVGHAVRKAVKGGGRRYQILAAVLTYYAVGLAYLPVAIGAASKPSATVADFTKVAAQDSAKVVQPATATDSLKAEPVGAKGVLLGFGILLGGAFLLPVLIVFGSMPSGLISALIIGIGMRQAWQITALPALQFHGPLTVAPRPPASS